VNILIIGLIGTAIWMDNIIIAIITSALIIGHSITVVRKKE